MTKSDLGFLMSTQDQAGSLANYHPGTDTDVHAEYIYVGIVQGCRLQDLYFELSFIPVVGMLCYVMIRFPSANDMSRLFKI